ncbi:hypothetical protein [Mycetocola spongiae]|uniref:hypothetical protein n=1 Tax=Mycetocola spongiae TaxID=2859226 RepID=UPI001CF50E78|nr:hypothetical protein [Mycetocola spongiae]UCR89265.1 hypothetical protein KXZ72_00685 [Mycetocola spongiae]
MILSPYGIKPGATTPDGRVVASGRTVEVENMIVAELEYTDGTIGAFTWPLGHNWKEAPGV